MNRIWHRITQPGQAPNTGASMKLSAWGLLMPLVIAGCATRPPSPVPKPPTVIPQTQTQTQIRHPHPHHRTASGHTASCAWSQVHGIAELVNIDGHNATYRFYPGDTVFRKSHTPQNANPGDEYKAIVRRPLNGPCDAPELVVVDPLP